MMPARYAILATNPGRAFSHTPTGVFSLPLYKGSSATVPTKKVLTSPVGSPMMVSELYHIQKMRP